MQYGNALAVHVHEVPPRHQHFSAFDSCTVFGGFIVLKSCQCASQLQPCLGYKKPQGAEEFLSLYKYSHLLRDLIEKKLLHICLQDTCMLHSLVLV